MLCIKGIQLVFFMLLHFYLSWEIMKFLPCVCVCVCVCGGGGGGGVHMHVCLCHTLKSSFISHSVLKISSPNLHKMFMNVKDNMAAILIAQKSLISSKI